MPISNRKLNIVNISFMPWSNMWKRNQSMMAEMSKFDFIERVIFVNPLLSLKTFLSFRNSGNGSFQYAQLRKSIKPYYVSDKLVVYNPLHVLPYRKYMPFNKRIEAKILLMIIKKLNMNKPYILFLNTPDIFSDYFIDELLKNAILSVFDFSDDLVTLTRSKEQQELYLKNIVKYASSVDMVITVNEHLKYKYSYLNPNIHVIKNATNYENFCRSNYEKIAEMDKVKMKGPVIGYSGIANITRLNLAMLDLLIKKRPMWQYVFVGKTDKEIRERFNNCKNVYFMPPVDYERLPDYISYFDVAIVPFRINEHTRGNSLLKLYDYLAMGKPVVSTNIGGADELKDVIRIAFEPEDFLRKIEMSLHDFDVVSINKRKDVALQNSWSKRINELKVLLESSLPLLNNTQTN